MLRAGKFWDAEQDDTSLATHFAHADGQDANTHANPESRKKIRERARFEYSNGPYARGIVDTFVNNVIGTGPRLVIEADEAGISAETARKIERGWASWAEASEWYQRLRVAFLANQVDGEGIAILASDPKMPHPVKLAWKLIETDQLDQSLERLFQVSNPDGTKHVDGIDVDAFGRPVRYHFLKEHPGSLFASMEHAEPVDAEEVIHLFRATRPGQVRGVSQMAPMLATSAMLRQYAMAVLRAARRAASLSWVMKTTLTDDDSSLVDPWEIVSVPDDAGMSLPEGYDISQLKAEQPTTTYSDFKREQVSEMGRPFGMPRNKAACDSSNYNYASGRLDHQDFGMLQRVEQDRVESQACTPTLIAYCREAVLRDESDLYDRDVRDALDAWLQRPERVIPHHWDWDQVEHADPKKEADADNARLSTGCTTLAEIYSRRNKDWRAALQQRAIEMEVINELGLSSLVAGKQGSGAPETADAPDEPGDDDQDGPDVEESGSVGVGSTTSRGRR